MKARLDMVLDCADPRRLAEFWIAALDYRVLASLDECVVLVPKEGMHPPLLLQRVPEPKNGKNRMHIDVVTEDIQREADRLEALGAKRLPPAVRESYGVRWITMTDPEGNEFCVCPGIEW